MAVTRGKRNNEVKVLEVDCSCKHLDEPYDTAATGRKPGNIGHTYSVRRLAFSVSKHRVQVEAVFLRAKEITFEMTNKVRGEAGKYICSCTATPLYTVSRNKIIKRTEREEYMLPLR